MYRCPEYVTALLVSLRDELDRVMLNIYHEEYDSPFITENSYANRVFEVHGYYWGDDENLIKRPNFKCGKYEIRWYKYLGRGMECNKKLTERKMIKIYNKCMLSLAWVEYEADNSSYRENPPSIDLIASNKKFRVSWRRRLLIKWKNRRKNESDSED